VVVSNSEDRRVELQIFYARPPVEDDFRALEALDVEVMGGMGVRGVLYATAPDARIPEISRLPRIRNVRARAIGCGAFDR